MKTLRLTRLLLVVFLISGWIAGHAQDDDQAIEAEVPGDNFSLEGALELFKKSASPEEFERKLNSADAKVNNLDLNQDGQIDYIKVTDRTEDNVHLFILQAVISDSEVQDIAVIDLEKLGDGKATLQITGDADIYGIETIIEPTEEVKINAGTMTTQHTVNVWTWPAVQYVYDPYYSPWVSPWAWTYRPIWWSPWSPVAFHIYRPWWSPFRPYYSWCYGHRGGFYGRFYAPYRRTSVIVYNRYDRQIRDYRTRNDGNRSRYGRNENPGGRYRSDGYQGRTRNERYAGRSRRDDRGRGTVTGRERREFNSNNGSRRESGDRTRTFTPGRSHNNEAGRTRDNTSQFRSTERTTRSRADVQPQRSTQRSSTNQFQQRQQMQRQPGQSFNGGSRGGSSRSTAFHAPAGGGQRQSPSFRSGGSSGSRSSGGHSGGSGGSRSSGGGNSGNGNGGRGRH